MEEREFELAIQSLARHAQVLLGKLREYRDNKKKIESINENIELVSSMMRECRQKSLVKFNKNFLPLVENSSVLDEELKPYSKIAQDTVRRMVSYKFPQLSFQDVVGHAHAKEILTRSVIGPIKHGNLWEQKSRTIGVLLFGNFSDKKPMHNQIYVKFT